MRWNRGKRRAKEHKLKERIDLDGNPQEATGLPFTELSPDRRCPIKVSSNLFSKSMDNYPPYFHDLALDVPVSFYQPVCPFYSSFSSLAHRLQYSQPVVDSLPLHAPIPLSLHPPMLYAMDPPLIDPVAFCEPQQPQQQPHHSSYASTNVIQPTFPTPSELLAELAANGLPATSDEFGSDGRSESARKARRRAMAKSVGFIPTDPSAPYPSTIIPD